MWMVHSFDLRALLFDWVKQSVRDAVRQRFSRATLPALAAVRANDNDARTLH